MFNIRQLYISFFSFIVISIFSACQHDGNDDGLPVSKDDPQIAVGVDEPSVGISVADHGFAHGREPIDPELLKAAYKGDFTAFSAVRSESCSAIKQRIVRTWQKNPGHQDEKFCWECSTAFEVGGADANKKQKTLLVQDDMLYVVVGNQLKALSIVEEKAIKQKAALQFDFQISSIYLIPEQNLLIVFGAEFIDHYSPVGRMENTQLAVVDVSVLEKLTETARYKFDGEVELLSNVTGEITLALYDQINIPNSLATDREFIEVTEKYNKAKELDTLYQFVIDNSEGEVAQEIIDFQAGTQILVEAYEDLFNQRFDAVVSDINTLLPGFSRYVDGKKQDHKPVSCSDIYVPDELENGGMSAGPLRVAQVFTLDVKQGDVSNSTGLVGAYRSVMIGAEKILLKETTYPDDPFQGHGMTRLSQFNKTDIGYSFVSGVELNGVVGDSGMLVKGKHLFMISSQNVVPTSTSGDMNLLNFFSVSLTDDGIEKIGEVPYVVSHYGFFGYMSAPVFMKDAVVISNNDTSQLVAVNFVDPTNPSSVKKELAGIVTRLTAVDDALFVAAVDVPERAKSSRQLQLIKVSNDLETLDTVSLSGDGYFESGQGMQVLNIGDELVFGMQNTDWSKDVPRSDLKLYTVTNATGLSFKASVDHGEFVTQKSCKNIVPFFGGNCTTEVISISGLAPVLAASMKNGDSDFVVTTTEFGIKLNEWSDFGNELSLKYQ